VLERWGGHTGAAVWQAVQTLMCARLQEIQYYLCQPAVGWTGTKARQLGEQLFALKQAGRLVEENGWYAPVDVWAALERIASSLEAMAVKPEDDDETEGWGF
jgi:hypothetical protein